MQHGSIRSFYDVGSQNGLSYLVMEYLEREPLGDRLHKGCRPLEQVLGRGGEICDGLERAPRIGLVHRDLKRENIRLTRSGAKLMDIGLAKPVAAATQSSKGES